MMKEGAAFHSPKDKEQKAFERRGKIAINSALSDEFSVMLTTQLLLYGLALTPVMQFVLTLEF